MRSRLQSVLVAALACALFANACSKADSNAMDDNPSNPFFIESTLYFKFPPFDQIKDTDYLPAFERGMAEQQAEIEAIANQTEPPKLENTLVDMERSGQILQRVSAVFSSLTSAHTNETLEAIRTEMAPKRSAHKDRILLNGKLFARVKALYDQRDTLDLNPQSRRLVERYYSDFVRAGAQLSDENKERLKALNSELAELQTEFSQNVLKEVNDLAVVVDTREELAGLSDDAIAAAAEEAKTRDLEGKYVIALRNTSGQPLLSSLENRALRERIHKVSLSRGSRGELDVFRKVNQHGSGTASARDIKRFLHDTWNVMQSGQNIFVL